MDYKIFRAINQFTGQNRLIDTMMITISRKMRYLFLFILLLMWIRNNHRRIVLLTFISVGVTLLLEVCINRFYFKPRPFVNHIVNTLPPFPSSQSSSFPSRHTTLAFAAATSVMIYKRVLGSVLIILAFLTGLSRIWMGQHYPLDIVGSALLGSLTSIIVKWGTNKVKL
ncbi:phosphatase PAP2 family protein [Bacillus sp. JJ722]|uniref:phosphatase PAP2 family protein n=1 Tax=Bacillus sp. JJ722 TaxID=3122973 RepID=UPI002FFE3EB4